MARVTKSVRNNELNPRGIKHPDFFAYHSFYEVSFHNDQMEKLTTNVIAENMLYQVDSDGHQYQVLKEISGHSADGSTLNRSDGFIKSRDRNLHAKKTTRG